MYKLSYILLKYTIAGMLLTGAFQWTFAQSKGPLFTQLKSSETNIDFNNKLKDIKEANILIYSNFYGGAGVGVGDFNQDGLADLFFAGNMVADRLYLNKGNFEFEDISKGAGIQKDGNWSSGVIIADVNQDGWDDIYVTRELYDDEPERRKNKLYINQGKVSEDGTITFKELATDYGIADEGRTRHATFLDFDRDGDLDLFLLNQPPNPGSYSDHKNTNLKDPKFSPKLYENLGTQFQDITQQASLLKSGFPNSVTASDFDQDGWTDLFVANDYDAPDFLYHNNGDGTFTDIMTDAMRHTSFYSMGVDAADINNDGLLDLMVLDMVAEDNYRLKANMSGMNPNAFWNVVKDGGHYQYMFNNLHLNQGNNIFSEIGQLSGVASTDWSWSNLFADFDNDGLKDLFITNGLLRDIRNTDADKAVTKYITKQLTEYITANPDDADVTVFDVIDLKKTLQLLPSESLMNYVYKNEGNYQFSKRMEEWGLDQKSFSNGSAYVDLNNDGFLDLVVNNINEKAFIYKNNGLPSNYLRVKLEDPSNKTTLGTKVTIRTSAGNQFFETTNVRGMYSTSEDIAHFGLGDAAIVDELIIQWPDQSETKFQQVKANQLLTITKESEGKAPKESTIASLFEEITDQSDFVFKHKENYFDDYRFQVLLPHKLSQFGPALAVGDVNGDQLDDVFIGGASGQAGSLFIQDKTGNFSASEQRPWQGQSLMEDIDAIFFDADGDQDLDLYVASGGNEFEANSAFYQDRLYLNDGIGNFTYAKDKLPAFVISSSKVLPFDYDQDGDLDLFVGARFIPRDYPAPASSKILQNNAGVFTDITNQVAPALNQLGLITDAVTTDLDGNNFPDLVLTGEWMPVIALLNQGKSFTQTTLEVGQPASEGWWFSITKADMDQDGDEDLILGNLGLNYKYKASEQEPFEVYYKDFDENGSRDIVLSYYNFGEQFPVRGRSCSSEQVPTLGQKFPTYDIFASSSLSSIYGSQSLNQALNLKATNFASSYAENLGDGTFKLTALPIEAQFAPINDVLVDDFNADGHMDILFGGNLFVSEIETSRADAGIGGLLLGNGTGQFQHLPATKSGLYLDKDIKQIKSIKSPQGNRIIIAPNNDHIIVLKNNKQ